MLQRPIGSLPGAIVRGGYCKTELQNGTAGNESFVILCTLCFCQLNTYKDVSLRLTGYKEAFRFSNPAATANVAALCEKSSVPSVAYCCWSRPRIRAARLK